MSNPGLRKPRFNRSADYPPLTITGRDIDILSLAERHRLIRSDHVRKVVGGSGQHLTRRLGRLYHAGLLERPKAQLMIQHRTNTHMACCIASMGQAALRDRGHPTFASPPRIRGATAALAMSHTLRVIDVMVALERSASAEGLALLPHHDWPVETGDSMRLSLLRWSVKLNFDGRRIRTAVMPDAAFALERNGSRSYFFVEVDRGTMPASRSKSEQSSFRKKVLAYKAARDAGILCKRYEIPGFRVLVVAESERRLRSLRSAAASCFQRGESTLFCFAVTEQLLQADGMLDCIWVTCAGTPVRPLALEN